MVSVALPAMFVRSNFYFARWFQFNYFKGLSAFVSSTIFLSRVPYRIACVSVHRASNVMTRRRRVGVRLLFFHGRNAIGVYSFDCSYFQGYS